MKNILLICVLAMAAFSTIVSAQEKSSTVIILDASGSMWGQIKGKPKMDIAKETLSKVVKDWSPQDELGLTVYGHRKKSDCNDIETVIPVGKVDKNEILSVVEKIQPKGKTPISRSLRKVADEIKYTEKKATIILISDGKESCDADPCSTAKFLEKEGIDFVAHVIGFDVDKNTTDQLQCIAANTGGLYFSASNAEELNVALQAVVALPDTQETTLFEKTVFNIEANVETTNQIDSVSEVDRVSAKYELDVNLKRQGEVVTLTLEPTVKQYSKGLETLALNIPGSWTRIYTANGKLTDIDRDNDTAYFNWNTHNIFSIGYLMLPVNDDGLELQKKWLASTFYTSLPMLEETEITITSLTDTDIGVQFKNIPSGQSPDMALTLSGSGFYDRKTLLLKSAVVKESLYFKTRVKRNGKGIVIDETQHLHFVIKGESR